MGKGLGVALAAPRPKYELVEQMVGRHRKPWGTNGKQWEDNFEDAHHYWDKGAM